jgi:hypothetical protein
LDPRETSDGLEELAEPPGDPDFDSAAESTPFHSPVEASGAVDVLLDRN